MPQAALPPSSRRALQHLRFATGSTPAPPDTQARDGGGGREGGAADAEAAAAAKPHLIFVSYRPPAGLDVNLPPSLQGQVLVHHHLGSR